MEKREIRARDILELRVDKYRVWGIEEIAKPEVSSVRPLSEYGTFMAITPHGYKYYRAFPDLPDDNTHMVVCVRFRWVTESDGTVREEKFVTTAYLQSF